MVVSAIAATALLLIQIEAGDERLNDERTFVSEDAKLVLAGEAEGNVLCLDNAPDRKIDSICLEVEEWRTAIDTAKDAKPPRRGLVYNPSHGNYGSNSKYGLSSRASSVGSRP